MSVPERPAGALGWLMLLPGVGVRCREKLFEVWSPGRHMADPSDSLSWTPGDWLLSCFMVPSVEEIHPMLCP